MQLMETICEQCHNLNQVWCEKIIVCINLSMYVYVYVVIMQIYLLFTQSRQIESLSSQPFGNREWNVTDENSNGLRQPRSHKLLPFCIFCHIYFVKRTIYCQSTHNALSSLKLTARENFPEGFFSKVDGWYINILIYYKMIDAQRWRK